VAERQFHRHIVQHRPSRRESGSETNEHTSRRGLKTGEFEFGPVGGMALADWKKWLRDPLLLVAGTGPLLLASLARIALPFVNEQYLPSVSLVPYYPLVLGFVVTFPPYIYGFVVGFFVLEDREEGVLAALRTTPLTGRGYLRYRGGTAYVVSAIVVIPTVLLFGLVRVPLLVLIPVTGVVALAGPTVTLLFAGLARDSIEGVASRTAGVRRRCHPPLLAREGAPRRDFPGDWSVVRGPPWPRYRLLWRVASLSPRSVRTDGVRPTERSNVEAGQK
jgi:hypothetical protein